MLTVLILCLLSGCAASENSRVSDQKEKSVTRLITPEPDAKSIGDVCEKDPWRITLVGIDTCETLGTEPLETKADDGMTLLILYFDVTNLSASDEYFNFMYFKGYADGKMVELLSPATTVINERTIALGTVPAESTANYFVIYQVPKDWSWFRVQYDIGGFVPNVFAAFEFNA